MAIVLATLLCLASGFLLVSAGWTRVEPRWADFLLRGSLTLGFGLGVFSVAFMVYRAFAFASLLAVDLAFFLPLLSAKLLLGNRAPAVALRSSDPPNTPAWFSRIVFAGFVAAFGTAVYAAIRQTLAHPHGDGWDAFAIWNLHARFLFLGGSHWRDGFTPLLPWSHPDYPLLLPAATAHFWSYLGYDAPLVPALVGLAFTLGTVGILVATLAVLRGGILAALAATALLATPSFVEQGTWQYADVPLAFFILSSIALLCLREEMGEKLKSPSRGLLFTAGMSAGLAAWTKNEGILFMAALVLVRQWRLVRSSRQPAGEKPAFSRQTAPFLAGIVPLCALIFAFKHWVAPPGDLFSDFHSISQRVLQPSRYWAVLNWYAKDLLRFGGWLVVPGSILLGGLCYVTERLGVVPGQRARRTSASTLALTLAGYAVIYLITPYDIYWHLRFSSGRLFLQLWPATILLVFLSIPAEVVSWPQRVSN
ncbi:MAG TPA: phospholipid carrier-dependent glycosyltransferase [Candidatus Sulfotelmatobacter sp.]|nr:phospholipid carrier-dependent glycosyltransferase [Candidatus Sulfotelmatobacter sp.]